MISKRQVTFDLAYTRLGSSDKQLDKIIEEMAELTFGIMKARVLGGTYSVNVLEEMGHVELCLEMIKSDLAKISTIVEGETLITRFETFREKRADDWYAYEIEQLEIREEIERCTRTAMGINK